MEKRARDIMVGSLLGDGWLDPLSPSRGTSSFRVKYNDKSLGYLAWIRSELAELNPSPLKEIRKYSQHYFYTPLRSDIGELRKLFYPNEGRKRVPQDIRNLLDSPIALAVWYQDDGTLDRRSGYHWNATIATHCFPFEDCMILRDALHENFGIKSSVCKCQMRGKMYYRLYVYSESMNCFIETIRPYVHENYAYKIT